MAVETQQGEQRNLFTGAGTTQVKAKPGKVAKLIVWAVGTSAEINIFDHASADSNKVFSWVTAMNFGVWDLEIPCYYGIRVVVTNAPSATLVWT